MKMINYLFDVEIFVKNFQGLKKGTLFIIQTKLSSIYLKY
jgi:hypothetical protein